MKTIKQICLTAIFALLAVSCSPTADNSKSADNLSKTNAAGGTSASAKGNSVAAEKSGVSKAKSNERCTGLQLPGKRLIVSQSFAIDFTPFEESCFATFGSDEEMLDAKDVPRGSTFHIFREGKKVLDLPDAFGGQSACWVEGVAFEDLNKDGLIDVAMAGRCLAAKDSYPSNAVYLNSGSEFTTDETVNAKIEEMKNLKEIISFIKNNGT